MPTHQFRNEDTKLTEFVLLPEGEYVLEVIAAEVGISKGAKTRTSDQIELTLKAVQAAPGATLPENAGRVWETLIFHPSTDWKVDNFVKSTNLAQEPGQEVEINEETVIGLRGWAKVGFDTYNGKKKNDVKFWITNKEKFSRHRLQVPTEQEEAAPWDA